MYIDVLDMSLAGLLLRLTLGLAVGFSIGLTGIGGGVLMLPALSILLGMTPVQAVGTTSLYAFLTKMSATVHHAKLKTIDWGLSLRLLIGAVPAAAVVSCWVSSQSSNEAFQQRLRWFIVGVVFFSIFMLILRMIKRSQRVLNREKRSWHAGIHRNRKLRTALCILTGGLVGGLIGATSIGGGVILIPMLIILFNLPTGRTVGSSVFIAVVLTLVTSFVYGKGGEADIVTAAVMAAGSLTGVHFGSRLSTALPERILQFVVIGFILAAAVLMLLNPVHS